MSRKKIITGALLALLVSTLSSTMLITSVHASYPGPDDSGAYVTVDSLSDYVGAETVGNYGGQGWYVMANFYMWRGLGTAQGYAENLWTDIWIDSTHMQGYVSGDSYSPTVPGLHVTYLACESTTGFYSNGNVWYLSSDVAEVFAS